LLVKLRFEFVWRQIAELAVRTLSDVEKINVPVDSLVCFLAGLKFISVHQFPLENAVKSHYTSVIVAVAFTAHTSNHMVFFQLFTVFIGDIAIPGLKDG
jgi:hypothetical protein